MRRSTTRAFATVARAAAAAAVAAMQTACTGPDRAATTSSAGEVEASVPSTSAAPASGEGRADSADRAVASVAIKTSTRAGIGRYLTDANGRSLYVFEQDTRNVSTCMDACAAAWPPFAGSARSADSTVRAALLGTIARADTGRQTTYDGMPVYYYDDDKRAGDIEGQGKLEFGGLWYLVSPSGRAIKAAAPRDR